MASPSNDPPAQVDTRHDSDSSDNGFEMTDEGLRRLTEQRDRASGEELTRREEEVRAAAARLAFRKEKKERQKQKAQNGLDDAVAPKPFDGALYSATGRRAEGDQKTEFGGWSVVYDKQGKGKKEEK
ncbi:hypothetical protein E8E11_001885 [Didymella keratinophila]|nr:hypothetical protein E8E11_001885 [Didymella keratinophila]